MPIKAILRIFLFAILSLGTVACSTTSNSAGSTPAPSAGSSGGGY